MVQAVKGFTEALITDLPINAPHIKCSVADEEALYRALRDGVIGGAALDTWWQYPSAGDPQPRPSRYPFHCRM